MSTSGHVADTIGLTGYETQLDWESVSGSDGGYSKLLLSACWLWTDFVNPTLKKDT